MNTLPQFDLSGSKALVTGASKGIGADIALTLAKAGADLIVSGRDKSELELIQKNILDIGRKCISIIADLKNENEIKLLAEQSIKDF